MNVLGHGFIESRMWIVYENISSTFVRFKKYRTFCTRQLKIYSRKEEMLQYKSCHFYCGKIKQLIIYYMANHNLKFVYIVIFWSLKTSYLHLSLYFCLFQGDILGTNDSSPFLNPFLSFAVCQHLIFSIVLGSCDSPQDNFVSKQITQSSVLLSDMQRNSFDDKAPNGKTGADCYAIVKWQKNRIRLKSLKHYPDHCVGKLHKP